ncbi:MAG: PAS domain S-box protein [Chthoniobacterales bacterium]
MPATVAGIYWFGPTGEPIGVGVVIVIVIALAAGAAIARLAQLLRRERITSARRAEEDRYRNLIDYSPDAVLVVCDERIVFANPGAVSLLGAAHRDELIGRSPLDFVDPTERAVVELRNQSALEGSSTLRTERKMIRCDGSSTDVESRVVPITFEGKRAIQAIMRDISERRAAEAQLRAAECKYHAMFDNALEGIFQNTPEGVALSANPALARMLGFATPEELIRERSDLATQSYADPAERVAFRQRLEREGVVNNFEYEVMRKDGSKIWVSENVRVVRDDDGNALYYEGSVQDITARKHSEEALIRSVERFNSFTTATRQIVWQTDPAGRVLEDLPTWRAYTGQMPEEILGVGWADCLHPQDRARTLRHWAECRAQKKWFEMEYRLRGGDGAYRTFAARGVPVLDQTGAIREWVGTNTDITEQKRAEEVLRESEQRFRFLNALNEAIRELTQPEEILKAVVQLLGKHLGASRCTYAEMEADGEHLVIRHDFSDGCASIEGRYTLAEFGERAQTRLLAGRTLVVQNADEEIVAECAVEKFHALEIKSVITCPLLKNGRLLAMMSVHQREPREWTRAEIALVKEVAGRCRAIIERAGAELVLRENEEQLRLVIAASNDGIWEHDYQSGRFTCSARMFEMLGLFPQSFTPTVNALAALLHPEDREAFCEAVAEPKNANGRHEVHLRIRRPDGTYGHFLLRGCTKLDAIGRPLRVVGSIADLTNAMRTERKLVEQSNLLNLAHDAIIVCNMEGRIEFWNQGAENLYGWGTEEARGRLTTELLELEEVDDTLLAAQSCLIETGAWSGERRQRNKAGATVAVRSRWSLVRDDQGKPKSMLVINTDVTEQKKIQQQFLRAQRMESLGTLASGVAHDLNNVLLPIMMASPVLRGEEDQAERDRFLDIVESSAQRGSEIIKQVLTFARGAEGDRMLIQPIYLMEEVAKIVRQTFPKSIAIHTSRAEDIRAIEADPTQLHQVLLNLCINARDAMPRGGQLQLSVENFDVDARLAGLTTDAELGPHVLLQVTDTGNGIPPEALGKIFDPFFTTKNQGEGTGLGLSTAAGIVQSHGGFLQVESAPGRTRFRIFLPAKEAREISHTTRHDTLVPRGRGQTILVVDDEAAIREVAEVVLTNHGYHVLVAEDGPTALAIYSQQIGHIAAVVTDLSMPVMSGAVLVRALRRIDPEIKILISTGRSEEVEIAEVVLLGIEALLAKPYTTRDLLLKLHEVLQGNLQNTAA